MEAAQQRQATVADAARGGAARSRERFHYQPGLEPHTPRECALALRRQPLAFHTSVCSELLYICMCAA